MQRENSLKKKGLNLVNRTPLSPSTAGNINGVVKPGHIHNQQQPPQLDKGGLGPQDIFGMIMGFQKTQILATASTLGVFDEIQKAGGDPVSAATVASHIRANPSATERLMNACVGLKLLNKTTDGKGKAFYTNVPMTSMLLVKSSPMSLRPFLANVSDMYDLWGKLPTGIREGSPQIPQQDMFDENNGFYSNGKRQMDFLSAMNYFSKMDAPFVTKAFDLNEFRSVCDLGGGTGAMAAALATHYPHMDVTVLELDHMVRVAQHFLQENQPRNVTFQSGDFFEDNLPHVDLFMLSHVVHDWADEKVETLLKRVYNSLDRDGAVLILEKVLTESKDGPLPTLMLDLGMMLGAEGRERTFSEYKTLLTKCGFQNVQLKVLPQHSFRDAILARKC